MNFRGSQSVTSSVEQAGTSPPWMSNLFIQMADLLTLGALVKQKDNLNQI